MDEEQMAAQLALVGEAIETATAILHDLVQASDVDISRYTDDLARLSWLGDRIRRDSVERYPAASADVQAAPVKNARPDDHSDDR
jgi:hypothetical protein